MTSTSGLVVVCGFQQPFLLFSAFFLAFILEKKKDFCLWLATVVIPFGFLGMYPSQTVVLLAMAAALWRRRPSLVMYECGTL
jgi:hypothetical protein